MTIYIQQLMKQLTDLCDRFHTLVYRDGDGAAAVETLDPACELRNLPMSTGAAGVDDLRRYLTQDVVPNRPSDLSFQLIARTGDRWRVADEYLVGFTHDREMPWLLPGVAPTYRSAEVSVMSMVRVRKALIYSHRMLWDLHGLESQLGAAVRLRSSTVG